MIVAQASCEVGGKPPAVSTTAHCCHCLAHATTIGSQETTAAIEYSTGSYRIAAAPMLEAADLSSPFKPPRL